jgi:hypothetical protein
MLLLRRDKLLEGVKMNSSKILPLFIALILLILFLPQPALAQEGSTTITGNVQLATYDIAVPSITAHSATIFWRTNGEATSQVFYDTEFHQDIADYAFYTAEDTTLTMEHVVLLTELSSETTYHYRVKSRIPDTEFTAVSDDYTFLTIPFYAEISIPTELPVSDKAVAKDSQGNSIEITADTITTAETAEGKTKFILPLALTEGQTLASFNDPETGIDFSVNKLTIPIDDLEGNEVMSIIAETGECRGTGTTAEAVAIKMELKSEDFEADLSTTDPDVGEVGASFTVELKSIPENAFVKATVSKTVDPAAQSAFQLAATDAGTEIADIAYTFNVERVNLENKTNLGEATITMKAGKAWAEGYGIDRIRIFRYTEEGESQMLPTEFKGYEGDQAIFEATSPDGLSIFGLVALTPAPTNWALIIGSIVGGLVVIAVLVYLFIRRRREKALQKDIEEFLSEILSISREKRRAQGDIE